MKVYCEDRKGNQTGGNLHDSALSFLVFHRVFEALFDVLNNAPHHDYFKTRAEFNTNLPNK